MRLATVYVSNKKNKHVTLFYKDLLPTQAVCIVVILLELREQEQKKLSTCVNLSKIRFERPNQGKGQGVGRGGKCLQCMVGMGFSNLHISVK